MRSLVNLCYGVSGHPWKALKHAFTCFSVLFTIIRAITHFIPAIKIEGYLPFGLALAISIVYAAVQGWKPSSVDIALANSNTVIEVIFGDIFQQDGLRAVAVNEFFDSKLGKPVSEKSVHGIFLQKCFGGHPESFDKQIDQQLAGINGAKVKKVEGKSKSYPIGTTALLTVNRNRYLAFAFAKTDPNTCKAFSDVSTMMTALHGLWQSARNESGGHAVNLPLVGSGLSGIGLPTRDLLNLIILSAITETKVREVTQRIRIVLHRDRFDDLDLRDVQEHWEK